MRPQSTTVSSSAHAAQHTGDASLSLRLSYVNNSIHNLDTPVSLLQVSTRVNSVTTTLCATAAL
jgi:hypothetical protein